MSEPLFDSRLKLARGVQLLKSLGNERAALLSSDGIGGVIYDQDSEPGYLLVKANFERPQPDHWPALIGEILHNERCALDYLVSALVRLDSGEPGDFTVCPILDTQNDDSLRAGTRGMSKAHRAMIAEEQPYQGRHGRSHDDPLWHLKLLSNFDKHEALHVVSVPVQTETAEITPLGCAELISQYTGPVEDGTELARFRLFATGGTQVEVNCSFTYNIAFSEGSPCAGLTVVQTLGRIGTRVGEIISRFSQEISW